MITTPAYVFHSIRGFWKLSVLWLVGNRRSQDCRRPEDSAGRENIRRLVSAFVFLVAISIPPHYGYIKVCPGYMLHGCRRHRGISALAVVDSFTWQQVAYWQLSTAVLCNSFFHTSLF